MDFLKLLSVIWHNSSSALTELWPHKCSPCKQHPCSCLTLLPAAIHLLFLELFLSSRRSLFSQASLLPHLLDIKHFGIACSCAHRRWYLRSDQHWRSPVPSKVISQGTIRQPEISSPHIQGWGFRSSFPPTTKDFKFNYFMVTINSWSSIATSTMRTFVHKWTASCLVGEWTYRILSIRRCVHLIFLYSVADIL